MARDKLYRHGDKVSFYDRFGKKRTGTIAFEREDGYLTLNMGGRYGTPQVIHIEDVIERRSSTKKKGNPMRFYMLKPRSGNPRRRRRSTTRRRTRSRRRNPSRRRRQTPAQRRASLRNLRKARAALRRRNPRRSTRRRSTTRRANPRKRTVNRRRRGPSLAASRKGGRKAARVMRRDRFGRFVGKKSRARNPRRRTTRRRTHRRRRY